MYAAIRGLNAFDKVCEGIRRVALEGARVSIRVTVQRMNYRALPGFVDLAKTLGAAEISFLAADVANTVAFGREGNFRDDAYAALSLQPADLPEFAAIIGAMERTHAADFRSGLIAESPRKLRRLHDYFAAVCGLGAFPPTHCNAPEFSAVVGATGRVSPCFFINGPAPTAAVHGLQDDLNAAAMIDLRREISAGGRPECATCVCSLWRNPQELSALRPERASHAAV
jgi:MoaA/NifB/PqqE/SkfB family radical SAM enzyme